MNKLLSARFWVTLMLTITFCNVTIAGRIPADTFVVVLLVVLNYYFAKGRKDESNPVV